MASRGRAFGGARRRPFARLGLLLALLALAGCRSNKSNLVEAELRTREREIRNLRSELDRAETFNAALQYDLLSRPEQLCVGPSTPSGVDAPHAAMAGMVKNVVLGRGTGGVDDDRIPGDEALRVIFTPQDIDGSAVKVPGSAVVMAYEVTPEGLKTPLGQWEVSALQLQKSWRSGLFSTGYDVTLPWKTWPTSGKVRVVVQFHTLPNNRPFEAERDVSIKPLLAGARPGATMPPRVEVLPQVPEPKAPDAERLPPPLDGPALTPGAWRRERDPQLIEAAKPGPARLLGPQPKPDGDLP